MVHAEAAEAAVSMLAAVADYATADTHAASHAVARKQKDQAAEHAHQQAAALTVLLEYASKGEEQQMVMLELFFCKVNTTENVCSARHDTSCITCCRTMLLFWHPTVVLACMHLEQLAASDSCTRVCQYLCGMHSLGGAL